MNFATYFLFFLLVLLIVCILGLIFATVKLNRARWEMKRTANRFIEDEFGPQFSADLDEAISTLEIISQSQNTDRDIILRRADTLYAEFKAVTLRNILLFIENEHIEAVGEIRRHRTLAQDAVELAKNISITVWETEFEEATVNLRREFDAKVNHIICGMKVRQ